MKKFISALLILLVTGVFAGPTARAEEKTKQRAHIMLESGEIAWVAGPASLPPGSKMVVLEGDPMSAGLVTMRFKLPPEYTLAPHFHGGDERVTVISGTLYFAMEEKMDRAKAKALTEGSFFVMPAGKAMFGFTKDRETVIQLNVMGPWSITYLNPADDPRKGKK